MLHKSFRRIQWPNYFILLPWTGNKLSIAGLPLRRCGCSSRQRIFSNRRSSRGFGCWRRFCSGSGSRTLSQATVTEVRDIVTSRLLVEWCDRRSEGWIGLAIETRNEALYWAVSRDWLWTTWWHDQLTEEVIWYWTWTATQLEVRMDDERGSRFGRKEGYL